jgi:hypothetical protein
VTGDAPPTPSGWYQDPDDPGVLRYWDGTGWSSSPPTVPPPGLQLNPPTGTQALQSAKFRQLAEQPEVFWGAVLACIGMGVGAVGTWATALGFISVAGTAGEDGLVVLGSSVAGLMALWARTRRNGVGPGIAAMLFGAVGAGIAGVDLHKLSGIGTTDFFGRHVRLVHPGWGIYLALGAGTAFILLTLAVMIVGPEGAGSEGASGDDTVDGRHSAGIGFVAVLIAIAVVIAVSNVSLRKTALANETATTPASNIATTPASASETSPTSTETATTSSTTNQPPLETLERYWDDVGAHNYTGAYSHLAPGASGLSESEFISSEQRAGIQHVEFHGQLGESSGSGSATINVVSLVTHDEQFGCRVWSGSYQMTEESGSWRIEKAALTPRPCG